MTRALHIDPNAAIPVGQPDKPVLHDAAAIPQAEPEHVPVPAVADATAEAWSKMYGVLHLDCGGGAMRPMLVRDIYMTRSEAGIWRAHMRGAFSAGLQNVMATCRQHYGGHAVLNLASLLRCSLGHFREFDGRILMCLLDEGAAGPREFGISVQLSPL